MRCWTWTVGTCGTRTGTLLLITIEFSTESELMDLVLVAMERQNTPKITFFTAVSRPFYSVQLL